MNPRAATNDLLPFQGSPFGQLGYFSKIIYTKQALLSSTFFIFFSFQYVYKNFAFFQHFPDTETLFSKQKLTDFFNQPVFSGEGGIRTHAPFRTNGFQDRLVMTTSIPLHFIRR